MSEGDEAGDAAMHKSAGTRLARPLMKGGLSGDERLALETWRNEYCSHANLPLRLPPCRGPDGRKAAPGQTRDKWGNG